MAHGRHIVIRSWLYVFVFLLHFLALMSGGFRIVSDTIVYSSNGNAVDSDWTWVILLKLYYVLLPTVSLIANCLWVSLIPLACTQQNHVERHHYPNCRVAPKKRPRCSVTHIIKTSWLICDFSIVGAIFSTHPPTLLSSAVQKVAPPVECEPLNFSYHNEQKTLRYLAGSLVWYQKPMISAIKKQAHSFFGPPLPVKSSALGKMVSLEFKHICRICMLLGLHKTVKVFNLQHLYKKLTNIIHQTQ